jgi:Ca-activated chloride channel family protein
VIATHSFHNRAALALTALLLICGADARPQQRSEEGPFRISAGVDLVVLELAVVDRKGRFIEGLSSESFQVFENGRPQETEFFGHEDLPVTIGLVIDSSGSMRAKRHEVILSSLAFAGASNPQDELFVVKFNDTVEFGLPPETPFAHGAGELRPALLGIRCAGQTALYDAVAQALDHLGRGRHERKALLIVSDGGDNKSTVTLPDVLERVRRASATVYAISLYDEVSRERNLKVLKDLCAASGGAYYAPGDVDETGTICRRIARELRTQYTIGYRPQDVGNDTAYRHIRVSVKAPGRHDLTVRTREGYYPRSSAAAPPEN